MEKEKDAQSAKLTQAGKQADTKAEGQMMMMMMMMMFILPPRTAAHHYTTHDTQTQSRERREAGGPSGHSRPGLTRNHIGLGMLAHGSE